MSSNNKTEINRPDKARELFLSGYNCAQAVFLAYADRYGLEKEMAAKMVQGLGGGVGRLREVCGAVSAAVLLLGLEKGSSDKTDDQAKADMYETVQQYAAAFKEKEQSIICRELLGLDEETPVSATPSKRTNAYYQARPCDHYVWRAAQIFEQMLDIKWAL